MNLTLKNITIVAASVALVLIIAFIGFSKIYSNNNALALQNEMSDSFDTACIRDESLNKVVCKSDALNKVLDSRARNPMFQVFHDPVNNVSFEYPSSVASVGKEIKKDKVIYVIYPIMPGSLHSSFWKGTQIFIESCTLNCTEQLKKSISEKYGIVSENDIEINTDATYVAGRKWISSKVKHPVGNEITVYATEEHNKLVLVGNDTEDLSANISKAFRRVIETLKTE